MVPPVLLVNRVLPEKRVLVAQPATKVIKVTWVLTDLVALLVFKVLSVLVVKPEAEVQLVYKEKPVNLVLQVWLDLWVPLVLLAQKVLLVLAVLLVHLVPLVNKVLPVPLVLKVVLATLVLRAKRVLREMQVLLAKKESLVYLVPEV